MSGFVSLFRRLEGPQTVGRGRAFWALFAVVLLLALAYPLFSDGYTVGNTVYFFVWVFIALSLCLIWGYGGSLSFGQTAFFGIAGYGYGILTINFGSASRWLRWSSPSQLPRYLPCCSATSCSSAASPASSSASSRSP